MNRMGKFLKSACISLFLFGMTNTNVHAEELMVSAAASLNNAYQEIASNFEKTHPSDKILFNFAASGVLLQQITQGAPVDVFASADEETMDQAFAKNLIFPKSRVDFAYNDLVLITPFDSNLKINELSDLNSIKIKKIAIGNPITVPAGRYTQQALENAGLWQNLQEKFITTQNVRQALDYVNRNEVDAGFVYGSDAALMPNKIKTLLKLKLDKPVSYPIAIIRTTKHKLLADSFIHFVTSAQGQQILKKYGFQITRP